MSDQHGFDFASCKPGGEIPPRSLTAREQRTQDWINSAVEPSGAKSSTRCASCKKAIRVDDEFGLKFGEHAACFE